MTEWLPIETAPKDGTKVLLHVVTPPGDSYATMVGLPEGWESTEAGFWCVDRGEWTTGTAGDPTHWMPLPPPPEDKP